MERIRRSARKNEPIFAGIDPGATGAICVIDSSLEILELQDYPGNERDCAQIVNNYAKWWHQNGFELFVALEFVHSMSGQGVKSMFSFGENYGIWKACLASNGIKYANPSPQQWMAGLIKKNVKGLNQKERKKETARAHLVAATNFFPEWRTSFKGPRGGIKTDRCAAALLAYWRRQIYYRGE